MWHIWAKIATAFRYHPSRETTHYHGLPAMAFRCVCFNCTVTVAWKQGRICNLLHLRSALCESAATVLAEKRNELCKPDTYLPPPAVMNTALGTWRKRTSASRLWAGDLRPIFQLSYPAERDCTAKEQSRRLHVCNRSKMSHVSTLEVTISAPALDFWGRSTINSSEHSQRVCVKGVQSKCSFQLLS